jgi:pimeloyl-ACP methyl ester carboxylesterase
MIAHPGLRLTDHSVTVPLDHDDPGGRTVEIFCREVVASDRATEDLPWLIFLQGGPGGLAPRPIGAQGWIAKATRTHRVLLLDQRGCGRSAPLSAAGVRGMSDAELAAHLRLFRADSIVRDAEIVRERIAGGQPWDSLGQSYGGFLTMTYLSIAPHGLRTCYVTGGLPGLTASADDVYAHTFPTISAKNAAYYRAYPQDRELVRALAGRLADDDVRLPDGDRLTVGRLRLLGNVFGMSYGYAQLHWQLTDGFADGTITPRFLYESMAATAFADGPLWALQEYCYGQPGLPATNWAAQRALDARPEFAEDADPLLFTGETMFPWMFRDIAALRPFAGAADLLAAAEDWSPLFDRARLASNEVPIFAAVYHDDMYVPAALSLDTAAKVGNLRTWVTSEHEHDGLRTSGEAVLTHLMDMSSGLR